MKNNYKEYVVGYKKFGKIIKEVILIKNYVVQLEETLVLSQEKRAKLRILEVGYGSVICGC